jgi:hypothetical protein
VNFGQEFGPRYDRRSWQRDGAVRSQMGSASARPMHITLPTRVPKLDEAHEGELDSSGDETATGVRSLEAHLHTLRLNPMRIRYIGKSSGASLIESALAAKQKLSGTPSGALPRETLYRTASTFVGRRPEFWEPFEVCASSRHVITCLIAAQVGDNAERHKQASTRTSFRSISHRRKPTRSRRSQRYSRVLGAVQGR